MPKGRRKQAQQSDQIEAKTYQYSEADSPLRPDVGTQSQFRKKKPPATYRYDSSLSPSLDWDGQNPVREPEMVKAYRDTWELGLHSYLTYMRDRLLLARELLHPSGSIFVQISDENLHHVRELMDEVFGVGNFVSQITFQKTGGFSPKLLSNVADYLVWYAKDKTKIKYRTL